MLARSNVSIIDTDDNSDQQNKIIKQKIQYYKEYLNTSQVLLRARLFNNYNIRLIGNGRLSLAK